MKFAHLFTASLRWLIGSLIILILILVFWFIYFYHAHFRRTPSLPAVSEPSVSRPSLNIEGFAYEDYQGNRKTLSIKAASLVVDKKKIGFFRFGLINTVRLNNAEIDIYAPERDTIPSPSYSHLDHNILNTEIQGGAKRIDFRSVFSPKIFKSISRKQIASIKIEPAIIRIYDDTRALLTIKCGYLKINLRSGLSIFEKGVQVATELKTLTTEQLNFIPDRCLLRTDKAFLLKTPQGELRGNCLETDLFLDHVTTVNDKQQKRNLKLPF